MSSLYFQQIFMFFNHSVKMERKLLIGIQSFDKRRTLIFRERNLPNIETI